MGGKKGNRTIAIGLMLFALWFGAGNLIFPASMGQAAGTNVWYACWFRYYRCRAAASGRTGHGLFGLQQPAGTDESCR